MEEEPHMNRLPEWHSNLIVRRLEDLNKLLQDAREDHQDVRLTLKGIEPDTPQPIIIDMAGYKFAEICVTSKRVHESPIGIRGEENDVE